VFSTVRTTLFVRGDGWLLRSGCLVLLVLHYLYGEMGVCFGCLVLLVLHYLYGLSASTTLFVRSVCLVLLVLHYLYVEMGVDRFGCLL
jgi:hypothetical protein